MKHILLEALEYAKPYVGEGRVATYIPELSKMDPSRLGIALINCDGEKFTAGDFDFPFTIQSVSKTAALAFAIMDNGKDYVFEKVGMEPTGDAFNSIIRLETINNRKPLNPMINAGAIAIDSMIKGNSVEERFQRLLNFFKKVCHNENMKYNESVYKSERETGHRNRSLAHFMKDSGVINGDVDEVLEVYFRQCSIEITCEDIAMIGAVLAKNGISPISGEQIIPREVAKLVKTFMVTCGMYDASGEFAIKVGVPSKSGVGGGIMAAVPGRMGIGVFGPALDSKGNSVGGIKVMEYLSKKLDLSIF